MPIGRSTMPIHPDRLIGRIGRAEKEGTGQMTISQSVETNRQNLKTQNQIDIARLTLTRN
jgi:hypothetical protein